jgi:peptide/nickel transport system ATP-binding protein
MPLVDIRDLVKEYRLHSGLIAGLSGQEKVVHAISGVSLQMEEGEMLGLAGESGCGKTTMGKVLVRLEQLTQGSVRFDGLEVGELRGSDLRVFRRKVQMIFQNPYDSLDPRRRVLDAVAEPLRYLGIAKSARDRTSRALDALAQVELTPPDTFATRFPHQLSGGQRQRAAVARALVVQPRFIVADEPVSMLDVSVRAGLLNLLQRLNTEMGITILLITHDLATTRHLCHRIVVMYLGKIAEVLSTDHLVKSSKHPYSRLLLDSVPDLFRERRQRVEASGEIASAVSPPTGCRFWPRCPYAVDQCREDEPPLRDLTSSHQVACHRAEEI